MKIANILVDYDNVVSVAKIGRKLRQSDVDDSIFFLQKRAITIVDGFKSKPEEILIRLYSGWHDALDDRYSDLYNMVSKSIRGIPKRKTRYRFRFNLATSLAIDNSAIFLSTVRIMNTRPEIKVIRSGKCIGDNCSLGLVERWLNKGCPNSKCLVKPQDVFQIKQQKTIDTMLVCDAIFYASSINNLVIVFSNDDDMIPGIVHAKALNENVMLVRSKESPYYTKLMESMNVKCVVIGFYNN